MPFLVARIVKRPTFVLAAIALAMSVPIQALAQCFSVEKGTGQPCISNDGPKLLANTRTFGSQRAWRFNNACSRGIDVIVTREMKGGRWEDYTVFVPPKKSAGANCDQAAGCLDFTSFREKCEIATEQPESSEAKGSGSSLGSNSGSASTNPAQTKMPDPAMEKILREAQEKATAKSASDAADLERMKAIASRNRQDILDEEKRRIEELQRQVDLNTEKTKRDIIGAPRPAAFDFSVCSRVEREAHQVLCFRGGYRINNSYPGALCDKTGVNLNGKLHLYCTTD